MNAPRHALIILGLCGVASGQPGRIWPDASGDATLRPRDSGGTGVIPTAVFPDLLRIEISGWIPTSASDWYTGTYVQAGTPADVFRVDIVFDGLLNPSGPMTTFEYDPYRYGPNPVVGYLEFDIDQDINTGCTYEGFSEEDTFLGNAARFGGVLQGPLGARNLLTKYDSDNDYLTLPEFERDGQDLTLALCGCHAICPAPGTGDCFAYCPSPAGPIPGDTNGNAKFDNGETWVMYSRYFELSRGYADASFFALGSDLGYYDPPHELRFHHDDQANETAITLVFAINVAGSEMLFGAPAPAIDYDPCTHPNLEEMLDTLIDPPFPPPFGLPTACSVGWNGRALSNYFDPTAWDLRGIFGVPYDPENNARYAYTDLGGMDIELGDMDGDGDADDDDRILVEARITEWDGTFRDLDSSLNGSVQLTNFPLVFDVHDVNYDGLIDQTDVQFYSIQCAADYNENGSVEVDDLLGFLDDWFIGAADLNDDGIVDVVDLLDFLNKYWTPC